MKLSCGNTFLFRGVELNRALHQLLSPNTAEPQTGGQLLEMAQEDHNETLQQAAASDKEGETAEQASPAVIEIHDSTTECEEDVRPDVAQMEEKGFISRLHSFMKDKGTPIERIPHLGFKQINLWRIYKAVDKLGGYDSVTARRLWKKVYDELGGSPGSTSAATCTRRHYERLVLPFERRLKGEEDKPLPPSKPRKPYKRSLDGKVNKCDAKRKKGHSDREMDSELLIRRSPEAVCRSEARVMHPHPVLWAAATSDRTLSSGSQPSRAGADLCSPVYAHILQPPASSTAWMASVPPAAGEVISPLEKKKRMAQASLSLPQSSQSEDKERPSVIHSSPSPARAFSGWNVSSSDGSPLPLSSSSSSRSPSPLSDSSEDGAARGDSKSASSSEQNGYGSVKKTSDSNEEGAHARTGQMSNDLTGQNKDTSLGRSQPLTTDPFKSLNKDSAWRPHYKGTGKYLNYPFHSLPSFPSPTSTSSFTKVFPKSAQLLRPAPIRPSYKIPQTRLLQQDESPACAKKLTGATPWSYPTEKKEKSRATLQKPPAAPQSLMHSAAALPVPCVLSSYDKSGRDSRHQPLLHPAYLNNRARLPHCQLLYRHPPLGPAVVGAAVFPYPYSFPLMNPQTGYTIPAMHHIYSHKL